MKHPLKDRTNESQKTQEVVNLVDSTQKVVTSVVDPKKRSFQKAESGSLKRKTLAHDNTRAIKSVKTNKFGKEKVVKMMSISAYFSQLK